MRRTCGTQASEGVLKVLLKVRARVLERVWLETKVRSDEQGKRWLDDHTLEELVFQDGVRVCHPKHGAGAIRDAAARKEQSPRPWHMALA